MLPDGSVFCDICASHLLSDRFALCDICVSDLLSSQFHIKVFLLSVKVAWAVLGAP